MLTFVVWHLTSVFKSEDGQDGQAYLQRDKWSNSAVIISAVYEGGDVTVW